MWVIFYIVGFLAFNVNNVDGGSSEVKCRGWGEWSSWSDCPVSCGEGISRRTRKPQGDGCEEHTQEAKSCNMAICKSCDPKTINFNKTAYRVKPYDKFEHDWLEGKWYVVRWFFAHLITVDDINNDFVRIYQKKGPMVESFTMLRNKTTGVCTEPRKAEMTEKSRGVYEMTINGTRTRKMTYIYGNEIFTVHVVCNFPNDTEESCTSYGVVFWARCPDARPQDIAKGMMLLRKLCYPDMKRFVDVIQQNDCFTKDDKRRSDPINNNPGGCVREEGRWSEESYNDCYNNDVPNNGCKNRADDRNKRRREERNKRRCRSSDGDDDDV